MGSSTTFIEFSTHGCLRAKIVDFLFSTLNHRASELDVETETRSYKITSQVLMLSFNSRSSFALNDQLHCCRKFWSFRIAVIQYEIIEGKGID